ncbi:MAG: phosphoglycerate dehydrogenase [Candidatus Bathyarchaeia archaeon]
MSMKILVLRTPIRGADYSSLEKYARVEYSSFDEAEVMKKIRDADVFIGYFASKKVIDVAEKLKMIQTPAVGMDRIDIDAATERGIIVCNTTGSNAESVAELTWGLIFGIARQIPGADRLMREGKYERFAPEKHTMVWGKTLGIIGFGNIGRQVGIQGRIAFNMNLIAYDPYITPDIIMNARGRPVSLETLMTESDVVSIHVPLSPATRHLIGEREIRMMKPTAFLINTSRGSLIDEAALIKCLNENVIYGAALEVFEVEPLPVDSPLRKMDNVIMTPHQGGAPESFIRMYEATVENVTRFITGQRPMYIANPKVLYR